jgi:hypothetical protein
MTSPLELSPDADELAFLRLVDDSRERRCRALVDAAEAEAREILRAARREALMRVRRAVREQRERRLFAVESAGAELSTGLRLSQQQARRRWLELAWPRLLEALGSRWRDPERRRSWLRGVVELALEALPASQRWQVDHSDALDAAELEAAARPIAERTGSPPELVAVSELGPGLRIHADDACVDGTIPGLLAMVEQIEARLLAEILAGGES